MRRVIMLAAVLMGCGGSAVIDGGDSSSSSSSSASSGGTATNGSSGSGTSTGTGTPNCQDLTDQVTKALVAATACDPCIDIPDACTYLSGQQLTDTCGCPLPVNSLDEVAVQQALSVYQQWVNAGCGPFDCGQPCAISSNPTCVATGSGCVGACSP